MTVRVLRRCHCQAPMTLQTCAPVRCDGRALIVVIDRGEVYIPLHDVCEVQLLDGEA